MRLALLLVFGLGCSGTEPAAAPNDEPPETTTPPPEAQDETPNEAPNEPSEPPSAPTTPPTIAPRPAAFSFVDPCYGARAATPDEAVAACRRLRRTGNAYDRRVCRSCRRDRVVTITPDDLVAFYRGCCWAAGDTPEAAVAECQRRLAENWCEPDEGTDTNEVVAVSGPHPRFAPANEFDDLETHVYFVPSGEWTDESGEPPCFPDGTRVRTTEGSRAIETLRAGDHLWTLDESGAWRTSVVRGRKTREAEVVLAITHARGTLRVTPEHPLRARVEGDAWSWIEAGALQPGDRLQTEGGAAEVHAITRMDAPARVHTLRTSAPHTFLAEGVLVHNY